MRVPDWFEPIRKVQRSRGMSIDHLRELLAIVVLGERSHRVGVLEPVLVAAYDIPDVVLGLDAMLRIRKDCNLCKSSSRCRARRALQIFLIFQSGIAHISAEIEPSGRQFHSVGFYNLVGRMVFVS